MTDHTYAWLPEHAARAASVERLVVPFEDAGQGSLFITSIVQADR